MQKSRLALPCAASAVGVDACAAIARWARLRNRGQSPLEDNVAPAAGAVLEAPAQHGAVLLGDWRVNFKVLLDGPEDMLPSDALKNWLSTAIHGITLRASSLPAPSADGPLLFQDAGLKRLTAFHAFSLLLFSRKGVFR